MLTLINCLAFSVVWFIAHRMTRWHVSSVQWRSFPEHLVATFLIKCKRKWPIAQLILPTTKTPSPSPSSSNFTSMTFQMDKKSRPNWFLQLIKVDSSLKTDRKHSLCFTLLAGIYFADIINPRINFRRILWSLDKKFSKYILHQLIINKASLFKALHNSAREKNKQNPQSKQWTTWQHY